MIISGFLFWIGIAFLEMVHGIIRTKFLTPHVGDFRSRQIGVASGSLLILIYTWSVFPWLSIMTSQDAFKIGILWFICMLIFEFIVGHYIFHFSWKWLINDYNIFKGRLLGLGMIFLALAPWIAGRLHGMW